MRPPSKARGGRNLTGFNRRATQLGGMQLPSNRSHSCAAPEPPKKRRPPAGGVASSAGGRRIGRRGDYSYSLAFFGGVLRMVIVTGPLAGTTNR
jgi:hypothetical protein